MSSLYFVTVPKSYDIHGSLIDDHHVSYNKTMSHHYYSYRICYILSRSSSSSKSSWSAQLESVSSSTHETIIVDIQSYRPAGCGNKQCATSPVNCYNCGPESKWQDLRLDSRPQCSFVSLCFSASRVNLSPEVVSGAIPAIQRAPTFSGFILVSECGCDQSQSEIR